MNNIDFYFSLKKIFGLADNFMNFWKVTKLTKVLSVFNLYSLFLRDFESEKRLAYFLIRWKTPYWC